MNLKTQFEQRYLSSLDTQRYFYDDVCEYGCPDAAEHVFYFIPGLNGVPGQVRFALPGFHTVLGNNFYIRCLSLPAFSSDRPIWEKYTAENLRQRRRTIREDLERMVARNGRVHVVVSSTAFYDLAGVLADLSPALRDAVTVVWVAAAPDRFKPTPWESVFAPLNGLERNGRRWTALPNHNAFSLLNPEARSTYRWRSSGGRQTLYKGNLESRFRAFGLSWAYFSIDCTNWVLEQCIERVERPLDVNAYILAGTRDGYWQGKSTTDMIGLIGRYLVDPHLLWKPASHLWINTPDHISEILGLVVNGGA